MVRATQTAQVLLFVLILLSLVTGAVAGYEKYSLPRVIVLPSNPLHPIKLFFERIPVWLTFNHEMKAMRHLRSAESRLAELNKTIYLGEFEHVAKTSAAYKEELNNTVGEIDKAVSMGVNASKVINRVELVTENHLPILKKLSKKVPIEQEQFLITSIDRTYNTHQTALSLV